MMKPGAEMFFKSSDVDVTNKIDQKFNQRKFNVLDWRENDIWRVVFIILIREGNRKAKFSLHKLGHKYVTYLRNIQLQVEKWIEIENISNTRKNKQTCKQT